MSLEQKVSECSGGKMTISNDREGYYYECDINWATISGNELNVRFSAVRKYEGGRWVQDEIRPYAASLEIYNGTVLGDGKVHFYSPYTYELSILHPPNYEES